MKLERIDLDRLAGLAQQLDREAEAKAFAALAPLAEAIARSAKIPGALCDDLTSTAYTAAIRAIRSYVPGDQSLKSYTRRCIQRAMIDEARKVWRRPLVHSLDSPDEGGDEPLLDFVGDPTADFGEDQERAIDQDLRLMHGAQDRMRRTLHALAGEPFARPDLELLLEVCETAASAKRLSRKELKLARKRIRFAEAQLSMFAEEAPPPLGPLAKALVHREVVLAQVRAFIGAGMSPAKARRELRLSKQDMRGVMHELKEEFTAAA